MGEKQAPGLATRDHLRAETARVAALCTACGDCFRACPMQGFAPQTVGVAPEAVMHGVRSLLAGEATPAPSLAFVAACTRSALCHDACAVAGLDPAFLMRLAKMSALGAFGAPAQLPVQEDLQFAPRIKAFARLTLTPDEQESWL